MRKRNREIHLFSVSAIDLFCSGMGAIMVLTVILMPYYLRPEATDITDQVRQAKAALRESEAKAEAMRSKLEKPFLVVIISWENAGDDVDLHVTDPAGRRFYFKQRNHRGTEATFEEDCVHGPGNEVWLHPAATPGTYRVEYVFYEDRGNRGPVPVRGRVVYQDGRIEFPTQRLTWSSDRPLQRVAEIVVAPDGTVSVR